MLSLCFIFWCQAQQDIIEVQLNCVLVTGILGDPIYTACKNCGTKVDLTTGHCKRHESHNCQTIREEEVSILATVTLEVTLADHTGEVERVLVDGERLQLLANAKSKEDLLALLTKRGPQAVCFCHPVDVRLATNGRKPGGGRSNVPAAAQGVLQSQEADLATENLPECQFQVLACQAALCQKYSEASRPMIKKVVRVENQRATGMVFPIVCPHEDLFSGFGVRLRAAAIFPSMSLCWCGQKMTKPGSLRWARGMTRSSCCSMLQYEKVVAVEAQSPKHFRVEAFCQLQQAIRFNMCDGIGKVTAKDNGSDMVLVRESVFKLQTEEQVQAVMAECASIAAVQMISSKERHAIDLVEETPLKVKSAKW